MADSTIVFLVLAIVVVVFVIDVLPSEVVAMTGAVALWATGVLELDQTLAGFGSPTVLFVASLLVVSAALDATGLTAWAGHHLVVRAAGSTRRLTVWTMVLAALLTSVITVHGAVAALIPVVVVTALRVGMPTSKLLMPLAFAAHAGSQLTLTGSQVNVLFSEAASQSSDGRFGFFDYTLVGLPLVAGTIVIVVVCGNRLLPHREPHGATPDYSSHASLLAQHYGLDEQSNGPLFDRQQGTVELVIPPRSALIGTVVQQGSTYNDQLIVLVVHRGGDTAGAEPTTLAAGDVLLIRGDWHGLAAKVRDSDVLVVDGPDEVRRHVVPWGRGAGRTLGIVGAMVVLLATGAVPPAVAGISAAVALIVSRVLTIDDAYDGVVWSTVVLIAAMMPLSTAMTSSGAADDIAGAITSIVGDGGPYVLLIVLCVVVAALTQLLSNTATALVVIPIAIAAAADLDVSARPVLMSLNVITVGALLTPVATAANTMVMRPGGYRFGDYWRLGMPLLAWWFVIAVGLVPLIWQF